MVLIRAAPVGGRGVPGGARETTFDITGVLAAADVLDAWKEKHIFKKNVPKDASK